MIVTKCSVIYLVEKNQKKYKNELWEVKILNTHIAHFWLIWIVIKNQNILVLYDKKHYLNKVLYYNLNIFDKEYLIVLTK